MCSSVIQYVAVSSVCRSVVRRVALYLCKGILKIVMVGVVLCYREGERESDMEKERDREREREKERESARKR